MNLPDSLAGSRFLDYVLWTELPLIQPLLPFTATLTSREDFAVAKAIHSMIRVPDEQRSLDFYSRAFGLEVGERLGFDGFTLVYLSNSDSDFEVELTINHGRTEPYDLGDGYG